MKKSKTLQSTGKKKVLLYLFGSLGDTLVAVPALRAVRRHFRNDELILLQNVPPGGHIVRASQVIPDGIIDGYLEYTNLPGKFNKIFDFYRLWRKLRNAKFRAAVYLIISERPAKSVSRDRFFFRACGINELYGFHAFSEQELYPVDENGNPAMTISEAERKIVRLEKDGINPTDVDFRRPYLSFSEPEVSNVKNWLDENRQNPLKRLISIAPGCKTVANAWTDENFIEIGQRILNEGNFEIVVIGGNAEKEIAGKLISAWGSGINAAGKFSVIESGILLARCDFHFGLDTGTTHLAASVGTPCFALYHCRDNPGHWFPVGTGHQIIFHKVPCAGCRKQICPVPGHPCMKGISVESVWENLKSFMQKSDFDSPLQTIAV